MASRARIPVHDVMHIDGVYEAALRMLSADMERAKTRADEAAHAAAIQAALRKAHG